MFSVLSVAGTDTERSGSPSSVATMSTTTAEEWNEVCSREPAAAPIPQVVLESLPSEKSISTWSQVSSQPPEECKTPELPEVAPPPDHAERRHRELMLQLEALQVCVEALCRDVRRR